MNSRTEAVFAAARADSRAALIGYLPAGFPTVEASIALIDEMLAGGVDLVEVGLPYSDPLMDGAAIQEAVEIALSEGTTTDDVLSVVERIALGDRQAAVVMSYWNPIERFGLQRFVDRMQAVGGSGVITPDLTPEEAGPWTTATDSAGIDRTFLVAPSSTDTRIETVARACTGFVYAASTMGVTGARDQVSSAAPTLVARVRGRTQAPIGVGLGVSSGDQAAGIAGYADGVIVGSAFVRRILDAQDVSQARASVRGFAEELAEGVRRPVGDQWVGAN
ncbi:MAG TPA: tryptophan synthase subunit alpha [Candidatus Nanopelagicales bacterium]|nr:tryptophan synthase subunit alpha [Candidatus Nanopelagicales bacterium]